MALEGFTPLDITLNLDDNPWPDRADDPSGTLERIGVLPNATSGGRPAIFVDVRLADGRHVVASTTWNLLYSAARAIEARYGGAT